MSSDAGERTLLGYLAGKVFSIPSESLRQFFTERFTKEVGQPGSKLLPDLTKRFLVGVFLLPGLFASEHALDYFMVAFTNVAFSITTGTVLVVSSLIPGDSLRWAEVVVGAVFIVRGYRGFKSCMELGVSMYGLTLSGTIQKLFSGNIATALQVAMKLIYPETAAATSQQNPVQAQQATSEPSVVAQPLPLPEINKSD